MELRPWPLRLLTPTFALVLCSNAAFARTWNVYEDGSGDAATIQAAINGSASGDSILVGPGHFRERLSINRREVTIVAPGGPSATTLDAHGGLLGVSAINVNLLLDGLDFVGATFGNYPPFWPFSIQGSGNLVLKNCRFTECGIDWDGDFTMTDTECVEALGFCAGVVNVTGGGSTHIERCRFEGCGGDGWAVLEFGGYSGRVRISASQFIDNWVPCVADDVFLNTGAVIEVDGSLFSKNRAGCIGLSYPPICFGPARSSGGRATYHLTRNTFARNTLDYADGTRLGVVDVTVGSISSNIVTGNDRGLAIGVTENVDVSCNLVWGNEVDWAGPDFSGKNGNISVAPLFCGPMDGDFTLAENSPCLPANNSCGVQIGAFGEGCKAISVEAMSWGQIKAGYRD